MSNTTPRTDKFAEQDRGLGTGYYQALDFARQLETELASVQLELGATKGELAEANERISIWQAQVAEAIRQVEASDELYRDMCRKIANQRENMDGVIQQLQEAIASKDAISKRAEAIRCELVDALKRHDCDVMELNARLTQRREDYAAHSVKQAHELQSLSARLDAANQDAERLAEAAREFARKNPRFIALDGTTQDPLGVHATLAAHAIRIKTP